MKKYLFTCTDWGDDTSILTQVSSSPHAILLCTDCYNLKYSYEVNNQILYDKKNYNEKT